MGLWKEGSQYWNLKCVVIELGIQVVEGYENFMHILSNIEPRRNVKDEFLWSTYSDNIFSLKSCYKKIMQEREDLTGDDNMKLALKIM